jgi:hypothetical protein
MKKVRLHLTLFIAALALLSCETEAGAGGRSAITGQAIYVGAISGISYAASGAEIYLTYTDCNPNLGYDEKTFADANGNFKFTNLNKGRYFLRAKTRVNGFDYFGSKCIDIARVGDEMVVDITMY